MDQQQNSFLYAKTKDTARNIIIGLSLFLQMMCCSFLVLSLYFSKSYQPESLINVFACILLLVSSLVGFALLYRSKSDIDISFKLYDIFCRAIIFLFSPYLVIANSYPINDSVIAGVAYGISIISLIFLLSGYLKYDNRLLAISRRALFFGFILFNLAIMLYNHFTGF